MVLHLMRLFQSETLSALARETAGALVAGLWQGLLLSASVGLVLKLTRKGAATLRFLIWAAVFLVSVAMPFANLHGVGQMTGARSAATLDPRWSYALATLWLAAAVFRLGQLAMQGIGLRTLWLGAVPVGAEVLAKTGVSLVVHGRRVELCASNEVDRPSVIGFFAPRILIPAWLLEQITTMELNHIVLHEMEHLRRRDDWVNLLQKIGLVLLPLNPALFWIDRRLSTERELACDDGVLDATRMPKAYAASLASIAERRLSAGRYEPFGALALAATGLRQRRSELGERIDSILGRRTPVNRAVAGALTSALVVGIVGAGAGLSHSPRLIEFGQDGLAQQARDRAMNLPMAGRPRSAGESTSTTMPKFVEAGFDAPDKTRLRNASVVVRKATVVVPKGQVPQNSSERPKPRQFVVLTSFEDSPVSRVVMQTPDGRVFLTPYAAVPTQAGWLLVQL